MSVNRDETLSNSDTYSERSSEETKYNNVQDILTDLLDTAHLQPNKPLKVNFSAVVTYKQPTDKKKLKVSLKTGENYETKDENLPEISEYKAEPSNLTELDTNLAISHRNLRLKFNMMLGIIKRNQVSLRQCLAALTSSTTNLSANSSCA